jgi:2-amino-4-hydroxy-6-hydroxymethyldihydropteridine diphosphokinase
MTHHPVPSGQRPVVLALGSNLGDRMACLRLGIEVLDRDGITAMAVSGVFETTPVGGPEQDNYLNAVLLAMSALPAQQILARCAAAESAAGRVRTVRWGPRTLDVDIITCDDEQRAGPDLTLPHPRAHERAFVLAPWLDVDPAAVLPGRGRVADLLTATSKAGVWRRPDLRLTLPSAQGHAGGSGGLFPRGTAAAGGSGGSPTRGTAAAEVTPCA